MLYKEFGKTGKVVSRLGMGGMRFEEPHKTEKMAEVVIRAYELGINFFDTAPSYCDDQSEVIYGYAFKVMKKPRDSFYVCSKTMEDTPDKIREACMRSLDRLGLDYLDFYYVWCLVHPEDLPKRKKNGVLDGFRKLKEDGLIKHICVSTHLEHGKIEEMLDQGEGLFEGMLIGLSAINFPLRYPGAVEAAKRGLGVVTMNTLGGGIITQHPNRFSFLMKEGDKSVLDSAIRFNLSLPEITVALVGFRNVQDVETAVDSVNRFKEMKWEEIEALQKHIAEVQHDFCTQCGYCSNCPAEIPIVRLMDAYNYRLLFGPQAAIDRLKWHWWTEDIRSIVEKCTQCRSCEEECTQSLPILERFKQLCEDYDKVKSKGK